MHKDFELQTIYILHTHSYRDTSLLLRCLSEREGVLTLLAKGAKRPMSPLRHVLAAFTPLAASWYGKGELKSLRQAELVGASWQIEGKKLFSGLYLNELLLKVLHKQDACPEIFQLYQQILTTQLTETDLRKFELKLLIELGYATDLKCEAGGEVKIQQAMNYYYEPGVGFSNLALQKVLPAAKNIFTGESLLAIAANDYSDKEVLRAAKRLTRLAFIPIIGHYQFKSRELFIKS